MNLPNKLTIFRVILVPFFMIFYLYDITPFSKLIALALFIIASLTDLLDGYLARKYNQITDFGKIMDPLADKMLVTAALICFVEKSYISSWSVMIILSREFIVSGIRIVAASKGQVIAASIYGKLKTVWQMISIVASLILTVKPDAFMYSVQAIRAMIFIAVILTVISGIDYIVKNRNIFTEKR